MKPNPNFNSLHYLFKESEHSVEVTHFLTNFLFDLITIYQRINPDKKAFTDAQISTIEEISKRINSPEWLENNLSEFFSVIDTLMEQGLEEGSKLEVKKILMEQGLEEGLKLEVKKISMEQGLEEELNLEIKKIKASIKIHALIREFFKTFESDTLQPGEKKEMDKLRTLSECVNYYDEEWINSIRHNLSNLKNGTSKSGPDYFSLLLGGFSHITYEYENNIPTDIEETRDIEETITSISIAISIEKPS